jgi:hypothetical protein
MKSKCLIFRQYLQAFSRNLTTIIMIVEIAIVKKFKILKVV